MSSLPVGSGAVCEVALARTFTPTLAYAIPQTLVGRVAPGMRVRVPLGSSVVVGIVDRLGLRSGREGTAGLRLRPIRAVLDQTPVLDEPLMELCRWVAGYYVAPLGHTFRAALPPQLLAGTGTTLETKRRTERTIRITRKLATLTEQREVFGRAFRQRDAYEALEEIGEPVTVGNFHRQLGFSHAIAKGLVERGVAEFAEREGGGDPFRTPPQKEVRLALSADQASVVKGLNELDGDGSVALLHGVTGSGKTLVYLEVIERQLNLGRGAILLVPEIALTPQTVGRFRSRFGDAVAVLHSGLSDGERLQAWAGLREGRSKIAIGPRSAVFAPVQDLGVIIVDEEHEATYKQSVLPRYHARSVAAVRARNQRCLCLLGSATPSLESWENAQRGRYRIFRLPERVTGQALPAVEIVDLRSADPRAAEQISNSPPERPELRDAHHVFRVGCGRPSQNASLAKSRSSCSSIAEGTRPMPSAGAAGGLGVPQLRCDADLSSSAQATSVSSLRIHPETADLL